MTYFSDSFFIFWLFISVVSIILLFLGIKRHFISDLLADFLWGDKKIWGRGLLIILGVGIFYYFRFEAHLYGEGYIRISNLAQRSQPIIRLFEFGSSYVPYLIYQGIVIFGVAKVTAGFWAYQLSSIVCGGVFLLFSIKISDQLYENYHDKITSLFLILFSGLVLMFFGMVENYPILLALASSFVYILILLSQKPNTKLLLILWAIIVIGIIINFQAITFIPAILYATLWTVHKRQKGQHLFGYAASMATILIALAVLYISAAKNLALENAILLINGKSPEAYYSLFSGYHFLDIFNLSFLFVPLFLVFIYAILSGSNDSAFVRMSIHFCSSFCSRYNSERK